mmetsp:Transcript_18224/g.29115  ORF Transcript_18224/g.29115 Transcript_18224/m.29115 type:complete len:215 (-) Transcript_18224:273-917(-)
MDSDVNSILSVFSFELDVMFSSCTMNPSSAVSAEFPPTPATDAPPSPPSPVCASNLVRLKRCSFSPMRTMYSLRSSSIRISTRPSRTSISLPPGSTVTRLPQAISGSGTCSPQICRFGTCPVRAARHIFIRGPSGNPRDLNEFANPSMQVMCASESGNSARIEVMTWALSSCMRRSSASRRLSMAICARLAAVTAARLPFCAGTLADLSRACST